MVGGRRIKQGSVLCSRPHTGKQLPQNATFTLAMCSNHLPRAINTSSIGGVSKKVLVGTWVLKTATKRAATCDRGRGGREERGKEEREEEGEEKGEEREGEREKREEEEREKGRGEQKSETEARDGKAENTNKIATTMTYRIHIGNGGCQGDEHIHVCRTVPDRLEG